MCVTFALMRSVAVASVAVLLTLLVGCSTPAEPDAVTLSAAPVVTATDTPVPPLTAETPDADVSEAGATPKTAFLAELRAKLPAGSSIPDASDEQLLTAAAEACEQMSSGTDFAEVSVIDGEQPNGLGIREDSALIAAVARKSVCP